MLAQGYNGKCCGDSWINVNLGRPYKEAYSSAEADASTFPTLTKLEAVEFVVELRRQDNDAVCLKHSAFAIYSDPMPAEIWP